MKLVVSANVSRPDDVYQQLIDLHAGRSDDDSARVNARLIMALINHIGDSEAITAAIALAGAPVTPPAR